MTSFVVGGYITFIGSFGIVGLAIAEGIGAALLYLSYVPVIIVAFGLLVFIGVSAMILLSNSLISMGTLSSLFFGVRVGGSAFDLRMRGIF